MLIRPALRNQNRKGGRITAPCGRMSAGGRPAGGSPRRCGGSRRSAGPLPTCTTTTTTASRRGQTKRSRRCGPRDGEPGMIYLQLLVLSGTLTPTPIRWAICSLLSGGLGLGGSISSMGTRRAGCTTWASSRGRGIGRQRTPPSRLSGAGFGTALSPEQQLPGPPRLNRATTDLSDRRPLRCSRPPR